MAEAHIPQHERSVHLSSAWYQFNCNLYAKLNRKKLISLTREAVEKAGSKAALERSTGWGRHQISRVLRGKQGSLRISNLKSLLSYLGKEYDQIGKNCSICHSRGGLIRLGPLDLSSDALARLIGALISDGSISIDKKGRSYLIEYVNYDEELMKLRLKDLTNIFGEIKVANKYVEGRCVGFRLRSSVLGKILNDLGVPVGDKMEQDPSLPWVIDCMPRKAQIEYLRSVFTDEGWSSSPSSGKQVQVAYSRAGRLQLKPKHEKMLDEAFNSCFSKVVLPSGTEQWVARPKGISHYIDNLAMHKWRIAASVNEFKRLLRKNFQSHLPKLLQGEVRLLLKMGFTPRLRLAHIFASKSSKKYSAKWEVQLYRKSDVVNFYSTMGFLSKNKQFKLEERLKKVGWLSSAPNGYSIEKNHCTAAPKRFPFKKKLTEFTP